MSRQTKTLIVLLCGLLLFTRAEAGNIGFIENKGQIIDQNHNPNSEVKFLYNSPGFNVQIRKNGFSYDCYERKDSSHLSFHRIDFDFLDINPDCSVETTDPSPIYFNYYTTGTPTEGVTYVHSFGKIICHNFYNDIDLIFEISAFRKFKYSFKINPGGDISNIRFKISGTFPELISDGSLSFITEFGEIKEMIPECYSLDNDFKRKLNFYFSRDGEIYSFQSHDKTNPNETIIIDPLPERLWGTYYGGELGETWEDLVLDELGNIYATGGTGSETNIATTGAFQMVFGGGQDGILSKWDQNGFPQWVTYIGGYSGDALETITYYENTIYCAGSSPGGSNLVTPGTHQQIYGGGLTDALIEKFSTDGTRIWGTYFGGSDIDHIHDCTVKNGILYCAGYTKSSDAISTPGAQQVSYGGLQDGFVVKFRDNGTRVWGTYYGGTMPDAIAGVDVFQDTIIIVTGSSGSSGNISTPGAFQPNIKGIVDGIIVRFDSTGKRVWGTYYGGFSDPLITNNEGFYRCIIKEPDFIYAIGSSNSSTEFASPGAYQTTFMGGQCDATLTKFNLSGQRLWATYYGGTSYEAFIGLAIDDSSKILVCGATTSLNGISSPDGYQTSFGGGFRDCFMAKFDSLGNRDWGTYYGGIEDDVAACIAKASNSTIILGGWGGSLNLTTPGAYKEVPTITDALLVKFRDCPAPGAAQAITGETNVCAPATISYGISPIPNAAWYHWSLPPGATIISGQNTQNIVVTFSASAVSGIVSVYGQSGCGRGDSAYIYVTIAPAEVIDVSVTSSANNICAGDPVTFTATATGGGTLTYDWKVNNISQGINNAVFTYSPSNGDAVKCILTSSLTTCVTNNPATSNEVTMLVNPLLPVAIDISPSQNNICSGTNVIFTASVTPSGGTNHYQWKVNNAATGTDQPTFVFTPANGDIVTCDLSISNLSCLSANFASSSPVTMIVNPLVSTGLTITASQNPVCGGIPVSFNAVPAGGGTPAYQWNVNGLDVGSSLATYVYTPSNGDVVFCQMTSSLQCTDFNPVMSNQITMTMTPAPVVSFTHCTDTITYVNAKPVKLKGGIPLGGTYSGPGVNSATGIFNPAVAGIGNKTISYSYTNSGSCSDSKTQIMRVITSPGFTCGNTLTDIRDNKTYQTVQIGSQCWMAEDLRYGTSIPQTQHQRDNCTAERYAITIPPPFGLGQVGLYQWDELMDYTSTPGEKGLCPPNWHVPTEAEWQILFSNWTNSGFAGSALKYSGFSGFNALLNGILLQNTILQHYSFAVFYWTSTSYGPFKALAHGMNDIDPSVSLYPSSRQNAFSVRCIKE